MQNEAFRTIARLKIAAARGGFSLDVVRLVADAGYAREVLARFTDHADEDGVLLALQALDALGLSSARAPAATKVAVLPVSPRTPAARAQAPEPSPRTAPAKYVGSLRG